MDTKQIGQHSVEHEEPDLITWHLNGEVSLDEAHALNNTNDMLVAKEHCRFLLIDLTKGFKFGADTRSYWVKGEVGASNALEMTIVYGGSPAIRAMAKIVVSAMSLVPMKKTKARVKFVEDSAEAHSVADTLRKKTTDKAS